MKTISPNFKRDENILILPNNTLRVPEAMFMLEYYSKKYGKPPNFTRNLIRCISRVEKDLFKAMNLDDSYREYFKNKWSVYYDIAPRTNMYEYLDILANQKFVKNATILFSDKKASDDVYPNAYYDGSLDELEDFIKKFNITALVIDDAALIKTLIDRKRIDIDNTSFIISKMGYNYEFNNEINMLVPKNTIFYSEKKAYIEVGIVSLFDFDEKDIIKTDKGVQ